MDTRYPAPYIQGISVGCRTAFEHPAVLLRWITLVDNGFDETFAFLVAASTTIVTLNTDPTKYTATRKAITTLQLGHCAINAYWTAKGIENYLNSIWIGSTTPFYVDANYSGVFAGFDHHPYDMLSLNELKRRCQRLEKDAPKEPPKPDPFGRPVNGEVLNRLGWIDEVSIVQIAFEYMKMLEEKGLKFDYYKAG